MKKTLKPSPKQLQAKLLILRTDGGSSVVVVKLGAKKRAKLKNHFSEKYPQLLDPKAVRRFMAAKFSVMGMVLPSDEMREEIPKLAEEFVAQNYEGCWVFNSDPNGAVTEPYQIDEYLFDSIVNSLPYGPALKDSMSEPLTAKSSPRASHVFPEFDVDEPAIEVMASNDAIYQEGETA